MSKSVILAAGEKINPLVPHTAELIVGTIAFTLLFLVLRSKVVPMFEKAFTARTEAIQGGMERAEKAQLEAQRALVQYNDQLSRHAKRHKLFAKKRAFKDQPLLKNFALKLRKKQHALLQLRTHPLRQSVNKQ